jgi:hypothetical protein
MITNRLLNGLRDYSNIAIIFGLFHSVIERPRGASGLTPTDEFHAFLIVTPDDPREGGGDPGPILSVVLWAPARAATPLGGGDNGKRMAAGGGNKNGG